MKILLVTARDPLGAGDGAVTVRQAAMLAGEGHEVIVALLEDAVVLARSGHAATGDLTAALAAGVQVLAEEEALARRAVHRLADGVKTAGFGEIADLVMDWAERRAWI